MSVLVQLVSTVGSASGGGDISSSSKHLDNYSLIIEFLNKKSGKKFKTTSKGSRSLLKILFDRGFTSTQIKRVIDFKVKQWKDIDSMKSYIRPVTLFEICNFIRYLREADSQSKSDLSPIQEGSI